MAAEKETRAWDIEDVEFTPVYDVEQPLFNFHHTHRGVNAEVHVNKKTSAQRDDGEYTTFFMRDDSGEQLGFVDRYWIWDGNKVVFEANNTLNTQREIGNAKDYYEQQVPIPRVLGASIGHIIKRGIVDIWFSSYAITPMGRKMYEDFLGKDPDLQIFPYEFQDGDGYVLTTK